MAANASDRPGLPSRLFTTGPVTLRAWREALARNVPHVRNQATANNLASNRASPRREIGRRHDHFALPQSDDEAPQGPNGSLLAPEGPPAVKQPQLLRTPVADTAQLHDSISPVPHKRQRKAKHQKARKTSASEPNPVPAKIAGSPRVPLPGELVLAPPFDTPRSDEVG
jgi:hypothetical protein